MIDSFIPLKGTRDGELFLSMVRSGKTPAAITVESYDLQKGRDYALSIAAAIMCEGEEKPCGECKVCRKIKSGHPDVTIVATAKNVKSETISVAEIREICQDAAIKPNDGDKKVYIFHAKFTESAQNALLKIFEEPPKGVTFIISCASEESLLGTILSRATRLVFNEEDGQGISQEANDISRQLFTALANADRAEFALASARLKGNRPLWQGCFINLKYLIQQTAAEKVRHDSKDQLVITAAKKMSNGALFHAQDVLAEYIIRTETNPNDGLFFTSLCMKIFK